MAEELGSMRNDVHIFSADFWKDKVYIANKEYPAGHFIVSLLNTPSEVYLLMGMSSKKLYNLTQEIRNGFIYQKTFNEAREFIFYILDGISKYEPFSLFDLDYERFRLSRLFEEHELEYMQRYLYLRAKQADNSLLPRYDRVKLDEKEARTFERGEAKLEWFMRTLDYYTNFHEDVRTIISAGEKVCDAVESIDKRDESHLIEKIHDLIGVRSMYAFAPDRDNFNRITRPMVEYFALRLPDEDRYVTARRMYFTRFIDFLLTDLFEGIHNGHFPKKCEICGRYFLMEDAYNQRYCHQINPSDEKQRSCNQIAADTKRREREHGEDHPVKRECSRRLSTINTQLKRQKITADFADAAKQLAQNYRDRALVDKAYANSNYKNDIKQESLYSEVRKRFGLTE